ncbi:MAG: hypothetical protein HY044_00445 [Candidatus Woesebacteria bacterium]|nr:MAG: hypothetical protein HY044_00445 [Candidatus Woesebacteria bacterium]
MTKDFSHISDVLKKFEVKKEKYISVEFQKYGYDLAVEFNDLKHKSLYIKLAKETPRGILDAARSFVSDAYNAKSKPRLFMWKVKQLRNQKS